MPAITASPALAHLRILDLTRVRAGPTCVKQFADFGADVIKIEAPDFEELGSGRESADFQNLHRNKRSLSLNLKSPEGKEVFLRLVRTADIVVENYRPQVKFRLGIDYESLKAANKRVILASISGFGQDGPYSDRPGLDQIAQGMSGIMSVTGAPGGGPMRVGAAVTDITAGLTAALGIMTALLEREISGEGQWVQANLLQAGIQLLDFQAARYTMSGEVPQQVGNDHPTIAPSSAYATADGFISVAASGRVFWERLCEALEQPDLQRHPDYAEPAGRAEHRTALNLELNRSFQTKTTAQWMAILDRAGVPCGPIHTIEEMFADPQVRQLEATAEVSHPSLGRLRLLNQGVKLSRTPAALVAPAPESGEHTEEVLREAGFADSEIAAFKDKGIVG